MFGISTFGERFLLFDEFIDSLRLLCCSFSSSFAVKLSCAAAEPRVNFGMQYIVAGYALSSVEGRVAMEFFDMSETGQAKKCVPPLGWESFWLCWVFIFFLSFWSVNCVEKAIHPAKTQTMLVAFRADMLLSAIGSLKLGEIQFTQSMRLRFTQCES